MRRLISRRGALRLLPLLALVPLASFGDDDARGTAPVAATAPLVEATQASTALATPTPGPTARPLVSAKPARTQKDVVYGTSGRIQLRMDLYYSAAGLSPAPVVLMFHGGGFYSGNKSQVAETKDFGELMARGYVVAGVGYRLSGVAPFPAAVQDAKAWVRHPRAKAARYGIDPDRIGAWGWSAGGTLAAMLGVTSASDGLEGDAGNAGVSSRVQAVVDGFGPN